MLVATPARNTGSAAGRARASRLAVRRTRVRIGAVRVGGSHSCQGLFAPPAAAQLAESARRLRCSFPCPVFCSSACCWSPRCCTPTKSPTSPWRRCSRPTRATPCASTSTRASFSAPNPLPCHRWRPAGTWANPRASARRPTCGPRSTCAKISDCALAQWTSRGRRPRSRRSMAARSNPSSPTRPKPTCWQ